MQKTTQILPPVVGRDYRLSNFWLAKEVNKGLKKEVVASVFIKTIKYYKNTNCTLKKGKKKSCTIEVLHANVGFFYVQLKCTANGISVQNVNVLPNIYGHIFEIFPYI
jgi:hypothetical protein